jgi:SAM-dependent methyltransferase
VDDSEHFDDPVVAYERVAAHYANLSQARELYLRSVENIIVGHIPTGSQSLLDIGAGDGVRASRIAHGSGITRIVLVEPSAEMVRDATGNAEIWHVRAENLSTTSEKFDVITCLWNVLGHIQPCGKRVDALGSIAHLLSPYGRFFLDVNHRYNLRSYGIAPTVGRFIYDQISPADRNGDVLAKWDLGDSRVSTCGHVFTCAEIVRLARSAGLELEERFVVDYEDGKLRRLSVLGNLLYTFRRSTRMDSSSAAQTC